MLAYSWPGNVRELENALERAMILSSGPSHRGRRCYRSASSAEAGAGHRRSRRERESRLETIERAYIMSALQSEAGNKSRAAETFGIDPSTLYRKLSRYGVAENSCDIHQPPHPIVLPAADR